MYVEQNKKLREALDDLARSMGEKINTISTAAAEIDEETFTDLKDELVEKVEGAHLALANYLADISRRMREIEGTISDCIDSKGFRSLGDAINNICY